MQFHILTLFPEMIENAMAESIIGRAQKDNKIEIEAIDIRDFTENKHRKVDDYTYGGGAGMLMQAQPVYDAFMSISGKGNTCVADGKGSHRVIYVTPQGHTFNQNMARDFAGCEELTIICGHYEGIDERVLEEIVTDYVSIGDFVLTGGELAAMTIVDAVARLVPGVLHNEVSAETESFHCDLLEYPQYSRPEVWHGREVPKVLLSGNQKEINAWRLEQSILRTKERRPDLYEKYMSLQECAGILLKNKLNNIDMIERINRGRAELIYMDDKEILLRDTLLDMYYHSLVVEMDSYEGYLDDEFFKAVDANVVVAHQQCVCDYLKDKGYELDIRCHNSAYTQKEKMPVTGLYRPDGKVGPLGIVIRPLDFEQAEEAYGLYDRMGRSYVQNQIKAGELFGAFTENGKLVAVAGFHDDGSLGLLSVMEEYRGRKIAMALETYVINVALERGFIPYGQVDPDNEASLALLKKLGLYNSKGLVYWMEK